MHLFDQKTRFLGSCGIVGWARAAGRRCRLRLKYRNLPEVTLCFFGDSGANQGAFFEGLRLTGLWKLPWSSSARTTSTRWARRFIARWPSKTSDAPPAFAIERDRFNGDDVLEVQRRIAGPPSSGPARITSRRSSKSRTYRFRGRSISDPGNYRSKDGIERWKKRDAVIIARDRLVASVGEDGSSRSAHQGRRARPSASSSPPASPRRHLDQRHAQPGTDPRKM